MDPSLLPVTLKTILTPSSSVREGGLAISVHHITSLHSLSGYSTLRVRFISPGYPLPRLRPSLSTPEPDLYPRYPYTRPPGMGGERNTVILPY
ncbi:uncharacterized protein H6S33_009080 [Morchella sextelata]|uniref:uncharacterized protein n=1 Tax=Morchella sextelata TaxID=1174677 RepID=UPI001D042B78|nr:uncharacterized protein H6S33_009080 [Morchella sextelata]KAH0612700.1 hypothetical protein H6S33_009080 [Morchella sextelata]